MLKVFVAFPYNPEPLDGYRDIFRAIEREVDLVSFVFGDEHISSDVVLNRMRSQINDCDLCMYDITGWNANVCLELGLALGLGKRVQLLFRRIKDRKWIFSKVDVRDFDLPVDIRGHGRIEYPDGPSLQAALRSLIEQEVRDPHPDVATRSFKLMCEKVYSLIEKQPGLKKFEIANKLFLQTGNISSAIDELRKEGRIVREGRHVNAVYYRAGYVPPPQEHVEEPDEGKSTDAERTEPPRQRKS